ncbi:MAG: tRNA (adenosine(37)-N6)-threonylcarbamoyltransferase complex ATPase subunit type 1 TsaE [Paludibacteraceae bacterium]|jgi:tRNA threonylcarbamoyladenosine biosynthesis protein TsaE|nr:tRNA (adenosine(37)-N6)-threonylcarbamoyltransferase complex ATPase subunit type 1 TsaE [Paludibacteraceae bacterium]
MYKYTIKKDQDNGIYLLNESGEKVSSTDIIKKCGDKRIFAFDGKMGAGKTTFIKYLCEEMGTTDIVNSPTFSIVNVYDIAHGEQVYHFDCYRIKDIREAIDMGTEEYLYSGNFCFIEWAEMIEPILPCDTIWIKIEVMENGDRILTI